MLLRSLLVLLACLSLAFAAAPAQAQQVQLTWDALVQSNGTPVPDLAGYKLYYGSQRGQYQTVILVGLTTTYTMTNVSAGQTYYFVITAYDTTGTESAFSNEVSVIPPMRALPTSTIPQQQMRVVSVDSQELMDENGAATNAIDGNATTFWHTEWYLRTAPLPHSLVLDLGAQYQVDGLRYLPRQDGSPNGTIADYQFYVSDDGVTWGTAVSVGTFAAASTPTMTASQNTRWELTLTSTHTYANPFMDVTVTVAYTKAGSPSLQGYGFWDGGTTFKLRQAFPEPGTWHYTTTATDPSNRGLHHREGDVQVLPYTGPNPLYRHGFLQVSADHCFLVHADGTPFLWLGDTLWDATVGLTEAGFHEAVAQRRAKHLTVLQTHFAHEDAVATAGDTPWQGDRWNVRFMQKLDRLFTDANDQGLYLLVHGLGELGWDRGRPHAARLLAMLGARYAAHYVSFASHMAEPTEPRHEQLQAAIHRTAPRHLVTQHPGAAAPGHGTVWTAAQSDDTPFVDDVLHATGGDGALEGACQQAIDGSLRLYHHVPPTPVVHGQAWDAGIAGGTAERTAQLGYLSFLSGNVGYMYGSSLWHATDADVPAWEAARGATYMQYLYDFFAALDEGRPFQPRHALITNQATRDQDRMVVGVSADGLTYAAFLPKGGTISLDLTALAGTTVGVTWYNPLTGQYHDQGTTPGGVVRSFASPFGASQAALVLMAQ